MYSSHIHLRLWGKAASACGFLLAPFGATWFLLCCWANVDRTVDNSTAHIKSVLSFGISLPLENDEFTNLVHIFSTFWSQTVHLFALKILKIIIIRLKHNSQLTQFGCSNQKAYLMNKHKLHNTSSWRHESQTVCRKLCSSKFKCKNLKKMFNSNAFKTRYLIHFFLVNV